MATTSMSLGPYWEAFLKEKVESGRIASASEVVREALRTLEEREAKLDRLRAYVDERIAEADRGELVEWNGRDYRGSKWPVSSQSVLQSPPVRS